MFDEMLVVFYLEFLLQQSFFYFIFELVCYGVNWGYDLYGFLSFFDFKLVKIMFEVVKGEFVKICLRKNLLFWR